MPFHAFLECPKCGGGFTILGKYFGEVCADDGTPIENFLNVSADEFEDDEDDDAD